MTRTSDLGRTWREDTEKTRWEAGVLSDLLRGTLGMGWIGAGIIWGIPPRNSTISGTGRCKDDVVGLEIAVAAIRSWEGVTVSLLFGMKGMMMKGIIGMGACAGLSEDGRRQSRFGDRRSLQINRSCHECFFFSLIFFVDPPPAD